MDFRIDEREMKAEKAILNLYKHNAFTDVIVKYYPGNKDFHAHKLILALYSTVLSDMFYGKDSLKHDTLYIEGFRLSALKNMLSFCYGERLIYEGVSDIEGTIKIAEKYDIKELINISVNEIDVIKVDVSNVLMVFELSMEYSKKNKENECIEIISRNRETVFTSELFRKMQFDRVCQILEKLGEMGSLTEVQYLRSALRWMGCDNSENKEELKKKIKISKLSMDEFIDVIISFPNFYANIEISDALQEIKSVSKTERESTKIKEGIEISTASGTNARVSSAVSADGPSDKQKTEISSQKRKLIISILDGEENTKHAIVTIVDEIARRSLRFAITGDLMEGKFALLSQENGDYTFDDADITYDGLYFMMTILRNEKIELTPVNYIEVLKVAIFFDLRKVQDACLMKVGNVFHYDPMFLDGLREFPFLDDRLSDLIRLEPKNIILHPNFVNCSPELIRMLLEESVIALNSELQLLVVTITWLEARNRLRWEEHRFALLNEIAFENISYSDLEYVSQRYPEFFDDNEINSLLLYKLECKNKDENKNCLPEWYNFKLRHLALSKSE